MTFTDWVAWSGLIIAFIAALFGALQWASAYRSAAESKRSSDAAERSAKVAEETVRIEAEALKSQSRDTEKALELAKRNADSAERLAEANEALAISGHCGWLVMVRSPFTGSHNSDESFTVTGAIHFRNVGPTPCTGIGVRHCISFLQATPKDFVEGSNLHYPVVAPDEEITVPFNYTFTASDFLEVKSEQRRLFVYGNLHYKDVFGYYRGTFWRYEYHYGESAETGHGLFPCDSGNSFE